MFKELTSQISKMEELVSKDNLSYEESELLDELYMEAKRNLEEANHFSRDRDYKELTDLKRRFKVVCSEFETLDDIMDSMRDMMFPDGEDD